jgi:hypothetical protein
MKSVYERLKNLQITLPDVPPPVVDGYVAAFVRQTPRSEAMSSQILPCPPHPK